MTRPPPRSTLFPYTTLFRSSQLLARQKSRSRVGLGCPQDCRLGPMLNLGEENLKQGSKCKDKNHRSWKNQNCKVRSEEHTSELQSHHDLVCRLLLEKKKKSE